jgi:hypothetical protein
MQGSTLPARAYGPGLNIIVNVVRSVDMALVVE